MNTIYDFDRIVDRKNTNSLKYDFSMEQVNRDDLIPLWVADMDFPLPEVILDDLHQVISHGIFGYSEVKAPYFDALSEWFEKYFYWHVQREWLVKAPGIVYVIAQAIRAYTKKWDCVLIQQPVYYPFARCILNNNRKLINNQLVYANGNYQIDFEDFENKIIKNKVKLFILCSPHNPVGRVWTKEELTKLGDICLAHNVIVLSDEIHCDFTYPGHTHTVFASINDAFAQNSVICTAPSKTFNLAGMQVSNIFIPNEKLRQKLIQEMYTTGYSQLNTMGLTACQSVYTKGGEWLRQLKEYLVGNLNYVRSFLAENLPGIKLIEPEGTYLIWLDCSALGLTGKALETLIVEDAKLWLDSGTIFSKECSQFQRINIACPRTVLVQAMENLKNAVDSIPT